MAIKKKDEFQEKLMELLSSFSARIIRSGICKWKDLDQKSIDKQQILVEGKSKQEQLMFLIQFTNYNLRQLHDGIAPQ